LLFYLLTTEPTNHFPKEVRKVSQNIVRFEQSQKKARAPIALGKKCAEGWRLVILETPKKIQIFVLLAAYFFLCPFFFFFFIG